MEPPKPAREYKQNDLFRGDIDHWGLNACVGTNGGPYDLRAYAKGYFKAGERIVESLAADHSLIDLTVYPLAFVYRHAVELSLKHLAFRLPRIWDEKASAEFTHKLLDNWKIVRGYLQRDPTFDPDDLLPLIDRILSDFLEIDPTGQAFRFPTNRDGNLFLQETSVINIKVMSESMSTVAEVFDFWSWGADCLWENKCEPEST
jgi:hypothetical protein